jgi:hypothetical protein
MSKGLGDIQRHILAQAAREPMALPVLSTTYAFKTGGKDTRHLRASLRRAAIRLCDQDRLSAREYLLPTRWGETAGHPKPLSRRWTLCVGPFETEWDDATYDTVALGMLIMTPQVED